MECMTKHLDYAFNASYLTWDSISATGIRPGAPWPSNRESNFPRYVQFGRFSSKKVSETRETGAKNTRKKVRLV